MIESLENMFCSDRTIRGKFHVISNSIISVPGQTFIVLLISVLFATQVSIERAVASPWTLPKDRLVVRMTTGYSSAENEFINNDEGMRQRLPLQGQLTIYSLRLGGRYGLQDQLELEVSTTFQSLKYSAQSFIKESNGQLTHLNTSETGIGDVYLTLTRQLISKSWPLSFQLSLKLPTGYSLPEPNQVALGSGQADISGVFQLGHLFSTGTLIGLESGAVLRLKGPGHQVKYSAKLAQRVTGRLFVFVAQTGYHSITDGEDTGLFNRVTRKPEVSAQDFSYDDTYLLPFTLTQDLHQFEFGFFLGTQKKIEYSGAFTVPWAGRNAAQLLSIFLNISHPL